MAGRRGNNEGSIYRRSYDGRWIGALTVGYGPDGRARRKTVSAKTRQEVAQKLKAVQRQLDDGFPIPAGQMTVSELGQVQRRGV